MSWEHDHYDLTCRDCGNKGNATMSSDDWNRTDSNLSGFEGRLYIGRPQAEYLKCEKCKGNNIEIVRTHTT